MTQGRWTWDDAGRLLFGDLETAQQYARARATTLGKRQRVRQVAGVRGYPWHVSRARERIERAATGLVVVEPCS